MALPGETGHINSKCTEADAQTALDTDNFER